MMLNKRSNQQLQIDSPGSSTSGHSSSAIGSISDNVSSSQQHNRIFTISVVGLSGTERDKGAAGVGKSCLCNRFVRPFEDDFITEHISTLSQTDFAGSSVINNDHWLYWGERSIQLVDDTSITESTTLRIIEQTEFIDDESFQPLTGNKTQRKESYIKRATQCKLSSPGKLMYICKDQFGIETEYERHLLPDGKTQVDGFIYVYDMSIVARRSFEQQTEFALNCLLQICKITKKPVIIVAVKYDNMCIDAVKEVERLLSRKELRHYSIPIVELSSIAGVNVDAAFILIAHLIAKSKSKPKILNYRDAERLRKDECDKAQHAMLARLRYYIPIEEWPKRRITWSQLMTRLGMSRDPDFIHFCQLFGRAQAQKMYRQYVNELREIWMQRRLKSQVGRLVDVFRRLLPPSVCCQPWSYAVQLLRTHPLFDDYFQPLGTLAADLEPMSPDCDFSAVDDIRIPAELLLSSEAETSFANYINIIEAEIKRERLQEEFEHLLDECKQVTPGKPLSDVRIFFHGKNCFESLADSDAQDIYDRFQRQLIARARQDFIELLLEHVDLFVQRIVVRWRSQQSSIVNNRLTTLPGLLESDMIEIRDILQEDIRYRQFNRLFEARDRMIYQYASFVAYPLVQHCPAGNRCADALVDQLLASQQLLLSDINTGIHHQLRFVIFDDGTTDGCELAVRLVNRIKCYNPNDLYEDVHGITHPLYYRIGSDANDGEILLAIYWSQTSFELLSNKLCSTDRQSIIIVLVNNVHHSITDDELIVLHKQGSTLADRLKVPFIDRKLIEIKKQSTNGSSTTSLPDVCSSITTITNDDDIISKDQLDRLFECASTFATDNHDDCTVDMRIQLCLMCGDQYCLQTILGDLLNSNHATDRGSQINLYLPKVGKHVNISINIDSYHSAFISRTNSTIDGYICVYSARRRASIEHLRSYCTQIINNKRQQLLIIAVGDIIEYFSDQNTNYLLTEGNQLADKLHARFITVSPNVDIQQSGTFTAFFEHLFELRQHPVENDYATLSEMRSGQWKSSDDIPQNANNSNRSNDASCSQHRAVVIGSAISSPTKLSSSTTRHNRPVVIGTTTTANKYDQSKRTKKIQHDSQMNNRFGQLDETDCCAPLATPEQIEVGIEYMTVKDAIGSYSDEEAYATLDYINQRSTNSDCDVRNESPLGPNIRKNSPGFRKFSNSPTGTITTTKPVDIDSTSSSMAVPSSIVADRLRRLNQELLLSLPSRTAPDLCTKSSHENFGLSSSLSTGALCTHSASAESIVNNSTSTHEAVTEKSMFKSSGQFVRKMTSSFRSRKQIRATKIDDNNETDHGAGRGSLSVPQSPHMERIRRAVNPTISVAPPPSSSSNHRVVGGVFVLPPVAPSTFVDSSPSPTNSPSGRSQPPPLQSSSSSFSWLPTRSPKRDRSVPVEATDSRKSPGRRASTEQLTKCGGKKSIGNNSTGSVCSVIPPDTTLTDLALQSRQSVPIFVRKCIEFIETEGGLVNEGLYRVPGNQAQVAQLEQRFVNQTDVDFRSLDIPVNAVATALKNFFSALAEPVIPANLYDDLLASVQLDDRYRIGRMRSVLGQLPDANREVLRYLLSHMATVARNSQTTAMDMRNLSKCWWPTLLRPEFASFEDMAARTPRLEELALLLFENANRLLID